jgi:hypothetical protein
MAPRSTNSIYPGDAFSKMIDAGRGILKVLKTPDKRTRNGKLVLGPRMTVRVPCTALREHSNFDLVKGVLVSLSEFEQKRTQSASLMNNGLTIDGLASSSKTTDREILLNKYKLVCKICGTLDFISTDVHSLNRLALAHISNHGQDHEVIYAQ